MNIKVPIPDKDYKVLVRCATYNQSKYICDALNGFAIQETDFPFICIVVDDASKDGNQEVIRQYANDNCDMSNAYVYDDDISAYMRVSHKTNTNCVYLFCFLKVNLYCKQEKQEIYRPYRAVCEFEAICEGDDYWIDPLKLQKQVDWMEANNDYSMCWHDAYVDNSGVQKSYKRFSEDCDVSFDDLVMKGGGFCPTASLLFRKSYMSDYLNKVKENNVVFHVGDYPLQMYMGYVGKVRYMKEPMCVYRLFSNGSWTSKNKTLPKEEKFKLWDKERILLESMNILTDNKFENLFQQRWCLFAFKTNCFEKYYNEAQFYYNLLTCESKKTLPLEHRMIGLGCLKLGVLVSKLRLMKNKVFRF